MNNKTLVMIGAGGHAKVCYDIAQKMNKWEKIIILDDNPENDYFEIKGQLNDIHQYSSADFFVGIGDNKTREKITKDLLKLNLELITLIHPKAVIASNVKIDKGTVIMAGVVINSATEIGKGCIINTSSSVDHDNKIGDYVHLSPGVHLAGTVEIGQRTWIGIGTTVINNIKINQDIIIGAGSLVLRNVNNKGNYYGKTIKINNK